jgi:hypothetical protein
MLFLEAVFVLSCVDTLNSIVLSISVIGWLDRWERMDIKIQAYSSFIRTFGRLKNDSCIT